MKRTQFAGGLVAAVAALALGVAADAAATPPGTPAQVRQLVAASHTITKVSGAVAAQLGAPPDTTQRHYPVVRHICTGATMCVFGDKSAKRSIVLFGDSHALMWLPALDPVARAKGYRLVVMWDSACPIAALSGVGYDDNGKVGVENPTCGTWRTAAIQVIHTRIHQSLVLTGERTSGVVHFDTSQAYSESEWQDGLAQTLKTIVTKTTRLAVIEDVTFFDADVRSCLAAYPTAIQLNCSVPNPNPKYPGEQVAERAAAKAEGATFISTLPWFCTTTCSPVIGKVLSYSDEGHVSATYAAYLSGVLKASLKSVLK